MPAAVIPVLLALSIINSLAIVVIYRDQRKPKAE